MPNAQLRPLQLTDDDDLEGSHAQKDLQLIKYRHSKLHHQPIRLHPTSRTGDAAAHHAR